MPKKALVVDDDESQLKVNSKFLTSIDFESITAMSAEDGLDVLHQEIVDIVILDYMLPKANGVWFLNQLRADLKLVYLPVILVSGASDQKAIIDSARNGVNYCLVKPLKL